MTAFVLTLSGIRADSASLLDPALRFRTLATEHFTIYFHQGEDALAARLAGMAEEVWHGVGRSLQVVAPRRTHVILADQSELANGWATPLPSNTIFITAAAPAGSDYIGRTDDWLRLVLTHEFTHIVHLDRSEGWARVFRGIFGRTAVAFPNLWLPAWQIEGLATWHESANGGTGRRYAGDFRAVEREAAREHRLPPLDRVNGGVTDWPGGLAPYAFGLGFHEYLANRFGEERFGELAAATARRFPFFGSAAFGQVYGRSLGALWKDYLKATGASIAAEPSSSDQPTRLTRHGYVVVGPRFLPPRCDNCEAEIAYSTRNPDGFPALRAMSLDGSAPRQLTTRYLGSTIGVARDIVVFDQQELHRNVASFSDLHMLDRSTGATRALTHNQRLQDPDLSPDGTTIACVREENGRRDLMLVRMSVPAHRGTVSLDQIVAEPVKVLLAEPETTFNAPRWSPDGTTIAVERHRPGALSEIVLVNARTRTVQVAASNPAARIVTPAWRRDGQAIIAAADLEGGSFNLYEFSVREQPATVLRRLTYLPGGALWPDVSANGQTLVFAGYTADGFDVFVQPYPETGNAIEQVNLAVPSRDTDRNQSAGITRASAYSPWSTLVPTSWTPIVETSSDQTRIGLATNGYDVLGRHAYSASATWLVSQSGEIELPRNTPDWSLGYAYDRWQPTFFVSGSRSTDFAAGTPDAGGRPTPGVLRETEVEAGVLFPFRHVRRSEHLLASVLRTEGRFTSAVQKVTQTRTAVRAGAAINTAQTYGYSISPEHGVTAGMTAEAVPRTSAAASATMLTADLRAFAPGIRSHHVLAVRAAGGMTSGEARLGRTFVVGGAGPNANVLDFGRDAFSLLRAFPDRAFAGTRGALINADYRWPIARPQRGVGTWPFLLHTVHAAVFADAGHVWTDRFRRGDVKTSVGAELSLNAVAGYAFPFTLTGGAAWGFDGAERRAAHAVYVRVGRAF